MSQYYITKRNSSTGKKFQRVSDKMDQAFADAKELSTELEIKEWRNATWEAFGGMSCVRFRKGVKVDPKLWKEAYDGYMPKLNCKEGRAIKKKMDALTTVSKKELNACVGFREPLFKQIGFSRKNKQYFGFITDETWGIKIPKDCKEITLTEYNKLFAK